MTTTPFSFYATKSRVKKDASLNHHTKMFECSSKRILATFRWLTDSRKEIQGKEYWSYQGLALARIRSKAIFFLSQNNKVINTRRVNYSLQENRPISPKHHAHLVKGRLKITVIVPLVLPTGLSERSAEKLRCFSQIF